MRLQTFSEMFEAAATRYAARPALVEADGDKLTYAELCRQSNALAAFLHSARIGRGDRVGLLLPKSFKAVIALLGVMRAGAAYVPMDPLAPAERNRRVLADCGVSGLFVHESLLDIVAEMHGAESPRVIVIVGGSETRVVSAGQTTSYDAALATTAPVPEMQARPAELAYVIYTSGSTGTPKGVVISHENVTAFVRWYASAFAYRPEDRAAGLAPLHFDPSIIDLFVPLCSGATAYLVPTDVAKNPQELAALISTNQITIWNSTPTALALLTQFGGLHEHDASSLRLVMFGGEIFPIKYLRKLKEQWPSPEYYNVYGPTEATVVCAVGRIPREIPPDREAPYPIGFPAPYTKTLLLDGLLREVAPGETGLLYLTGPSISLGYWNRPAENAASFVEIDGLRWYNTGDLVRWDPLDGFCFIGRKDRMVKRRGFRIELDDIERALYRHPRVRDAAVVAFTDAESTVRIAAFLALSGETEPSLIEFKIFCAAQIPSYMSPDSFIFQEQLLPRTSSGKINYQALTRSLSPPQTYAKATAVAKEAEQKVTCPAEVAE